MSVQHSEPVQAREPWQDRQSALCEFSLKALRSLDLNAILTEACALAARGLRVPIGKVLQVVPGERDLLLRASVGIPPSVAIPGQTRVPGHKGSAAGFALTINEPVVSHLESETRFTVSEIVRKLDAKVSANVLIPSQEGPFGVLEADSLQEREFLSEDVDFLQIYATLLGAAVDRQRTGERLRTLMRELQHRVKNDLQIITALLTLESRQAEGVEARARLSSVASQVNSLRLVHDLLYVGGEVNQVDLADYLRELSTQRCRMHGSERGGIELNLQLVSASVEHEQAIALGLITNEFLTNSLKYAFPMGRGVITVMLERSDDTGLRLVLADNGMGLPAVLPQEGRGMGTRLIGMMAGQIGAKFVWSNEEGTRLVVSIPAQASRAGQP